MNRRILVVDDDADTRGRRRGSRQQPKHAVAVRFAHGNHRYWSRVPHVVLKGPPMAGGRRRVAQCRMGG
jgi:hypothetical protein